MSVRVIKRCDRCDDNTIVCDSYVLCETDSDSDARRIWSGELCGKCEEEVVAFIRLKVDRMGRS